MCRRWIGIVLAIALLLGDSAIAAQFAFQITFTDKNNTPYSLSSPLVYLSARSLARRTTQGIAVDSTDLPVNPAYIDSVLTLTGGTFHETSRWLDMCIILLHDADSSQILHLIGKSFIRDIKLVGHYTSDLHRSSNITGTHSASSVKRTTTGDSGYYNDTWPETELVNGNFLHDNGFKGQGKLIAVIDAGYIGTNTHPGFDSLWSNNRVVDRYNFTFHEDYVFTQDDHGTEVLSTMAGYQPGTFVGSAPLAMYALYVSEWDIDASDDEPLELDNLLCAAERADSVGADIITESLGYDVFSLPFSGFSFSDLDGKTTIGARAANMATMKGMLFVATAGNDGTGGPGGWGTHITTPGDADSALTIGSVDAFGTSSDFSGFGPNAAGQIKPDVCGMGEGAYTFNGSNGYATPGGTSISTPQIAGWAACLWQANPNATPYQIKQAIIRCASHYTSPGNQIGYGVPNFQCTEQALGVDKVPAMPKSVWIIPAPNPFSDDLKLYVSPEESGNVDLEIYDITGKKAFSSQRFLYKGYNIPVTLPLQSLAAGVYILKAVSATQQQTLKLEKL